MFFLFKRIFDVVLSTLVFVLLSPFFFILTILLTLSNEGDPYFFQKRSGKQGRIFSIIKFKTMNDKTDDKGNLLSDAERLTAVGRIMRKTSLDEIPQLFNVLKGDMSLIGPRPLLPEYLPLYNDFQKRRHEVKPGITGWAQVNGRNAISWEEKFNYDVWYVDHINFLLDLKILYLTIKKVIKREGITSENSASAEAFKGN